MVVVEVEPTTEHGQAGSSHSLRILYAFPLLTNPQAPPHNKIIIYFVAYFLSNILCKEMHFFFLRTHQSHICVSRTEKELQRAQSSKAAGNC